MVNPIGEINVIALWMTTTALGFTSPFWMTYRQASGLGGQVVRAKKLAHCVRRQDGQGAAGLACNLSVTISSRCV